MKTLDWSETQDTTVYYVNAHTTNFHHMSHTEAAMCENPNMVRVIVDKALSSQELDVMFDELFSTWVHQDRDEALSRDAWRESMAERKANGISVMSYEDWLDFQDFQSKLFEQLDNQR